MDLPTITAIIAAATSAVGLIDKIAAQIERFHNKEPETGLVEEPRVMIKNEDNAIVLRDRGKVMQTVTAENMKDKLKESELLHIKVLEKSMQNHYNIWATVYPQLALLGNDPIAKARIELQLNDIILGMKTDLLNILKFLEDLGLDLQDHYGRIRHVLASYAPAGANDSGG